MEFSAVYRRRPPRETPFGPGAKKDGCFRRLYKHEQICVEDVLLRTLNSPLSFVRAQFRALKSQVIKISQSWPGMCSRVHLNFAVVIFQIFIFVLLCCIFLPGLRFQVRLAAVFGDLSLVSSPLLGIMIRRLCFRRMFRNYVVSSLRTFALIVSAHPYCAYESHATLCTSARTKS